MVHMGLDMAIMVDIGTNMSDRSRSFHSSCRNLGFSPFPVVQYRGIAFGTEGLTIRACA